jgi:predicted Zn-dependent protease
LKGSIQSRYQIEIQNPAPQVNTLRTIDADIDKIFEEAGFNRQTYQLVFIKATLLTYYFDDSDTANELLEKTKLLPLNAAELAEVKMHQADLLLFEDEVWEATLLYSQVDKAMKDEPLGHEARYRNARLRYFIGEFEWAQVQLDILKAATSKLIANDALQLSLLISDNLADDTTGVSLKAFAKADLRTWQKREEEAGFLLDSLAVNSKSLTLKPHILLKKAELLIMKEKFQEADSVLSELYLNYADHYLADDALFRSAQLNEVRLNDTENARKLYEIVFNQYPASIFAVQARQKYRLLRGDTL